MLRKMLVIALVALIASACSTSRIVSSRAEVRGLKAEVRSQKSEVRGLRAEVRSQRDEVHDTLTITKTITIRENERGDTVRMSVVTDRERSKAEVRGLRAEVRSKRAEVRSQKDEVRGLRAEVRSQKDEVRGLGVEGAATRTSLVVSALKWVFWIIIAIITLTITITITRVFRKH